LPARTPGELLIAGSLLAADMQITTGWCGGSVTPSTSTGCGG
jgi:hypothetical protein